MQRILGGLLAVCLSVAIGAASSIEYEVKAAFLYNFAKFTEWPATAIGDDDELNLCVAGNDSFGSVRDTLQGKEVQGHALTINKIQIVTEADDCHILFVSTSEAGRLETLMETVVGRQGILSVSDIAGFAKHGGIIELKVIDNKVRFAINLRAARQAELNLSSKLLRLATVVEE